MIETIITIVVLIGLFSLIATMIKYEHARPYLIALFVFVWSFGGLYSGFTALKYYNSQSKVIGEIEHFDPYENFNFFEYKLDSITWFEKTLPNQEKSYYYFTTYATTIEFDGTENKYNMLINNKPCKVTDSTYGRIQGIYCLNFYDVNGQKINNIDLNIQLTFYTSKIDLKIDTTATALNIGLLKEYVAVNGFEIRLINEVYAGGTT